MTCCLGKDGWFVQMATCRGAYPWQFPDVYLHPPAVDIGQFDVDTFRHLGPGGIDKHDDGAVLEVVNSPEHIGHFVFRQNQRECFGNLWRVSPSLCGKCLQKETAGQNTPFLHYPVRGSRRSAYFGSKP